MDFGFHLCMSRALLMHMSAEEARKISVQAGMEQMYSCINSLDSRLDKQRFLESNHTAFMIPKKFEFQGQRDEVSSLLCISVLLACLDMFICGAETGMELKRSVVIIMRIGDSQFYMGHIKNLVVRKFLIESEGTKICPYFATACVTVTFSGLM